MLNVISSGAKLKIAISRDTNGAVLNHYSSSPSPDQGPIQQETKTVWGHVSHERLLSCPLFFLKETEAFGPHDRGARTHEQGPSFCFIKSQRRPQTKKKRTEESEQEDRLNENAKKKRIDKESVERVEKREEKKKKNIETERKLVTRTSEHKKKQKQRGTLVNQPSLINIFVFKQRLLKTNTETTRG